MEGTNFMTSKFLRARKIFPSQDKKSFSLFLWGLFFEPFIIWEGGAGK